MGKISASFLFSAFSLLWGIPNTNTSDNFYFSFIGEKLEVGFTCIVSVSLGGGAHDDGKWRGL